ncbi:hypothetical protein COCNU_06G002130 [Cocos nucifera]|uniref:Uncharacterized protein n=1 Tax=Cocos nucifera TaxID=13894 RepID=A0A8K0I9V4_COCNU|nr:hypothetical protein COCNU_06G002130 [Cocos nucifera]
MSLVLPEIPWLSLRSTPGLFEKLLILFAEISSSTLDCCTAESLSASMPLEKHYYSTPVLLA